MYTQTCMTHTHIHLCTHQAQSSYEMGGRERQPPQMLKRCEIRIKTRLVILTCYVVKYHRASYIV